MPSESERDISVGGVDLVPAAVFDGVDYVALGHLHRPQTLSPRLRYSGSPLAYSFSEAGQQKQAWLVDLDAAGLADVRASAAAHAAPRSTVLTGDARRPARPIPAHAGVEEHFVSARLTDPVRPADPMRRLQARFPHCVHLEWTGAGAGGDGAQLPGAAARPQRRGDRRRVRRATSAACRATAGRARAARPRAGAPPSGRRSTA